MPDIRYVYLYNLDEFDNTDLFRALDAEGIIRDVKKGYDVVLNDLQVNALRRWFVLEPGTGIQHAPEAPPWTLNDFYVKSSEVSQPYGVASLDSDGYVPLAELNPDYLDGDGDPLPVRQVATISADFDAYATHATGFVTLGSIYEVLRIATTETIRLRIYTSDAKRTADSSREMGQEPVGDHGLVLEAAFNYEDSGGTFDMSPVPTGFAPTNSIPYRIDLLDGEFGSDHEVQVSITFINREGTL